MISEDKWFYFSGGAKARDLSELEDCIRQMDEGEFAFHVNSGKNDFANWTEHVLGKKELADEMRRAFERDAIIRIIRQHTHETELKSVPDFKVSDVQEEIVQAIKESDAAGDDDYGGDSAEVKSSLANSHVVSEKPFTEEEMKDLAAEAREEFEQRREGRTPLESEDNGLRDRIAEAMKRSEVPREVFTHAGTKEHRFVVKEFIYGFVLGLIFGLIMLGVLFNLQP